METINIELKEFVIHFCRENRIKNIDLFNIDLNTSLEIDLNLDEYEIDSFLEEFSNRFNVSFSGFKAEQYLFTNSHFLLLDLMRSIFGYKSKWIKRWANEKYKPKLFLRTLQTAIKRGEI